MSCPNPLALSICALTCAGCSALVGFDDLRFEDAAQTSSPSSTTNSAGGGGPGGGASMGGTGPGGAGGTGGTIGAGGATGGSAGCADPGKQIVFVTPTPIALPSSITAFRDKCNAAARGHCGAKSFVAWASEQEDGVSTVVAKDEIPAGAWHRPDGTPVAMSKADLTDGSLLARINVTPSGMIMGANTKVWTGTTSEGSQSLFDCELWSSTSSTATIGSSNEMSSAWTEQMTASCAGSYHLYCFQAP